MLPTRAGKQRVFETTASKNMTRAKQQSISVGWHPVRWYSCFLFVKPEIFLRQISFLQIPSLLKLYMYQLSSMKHGVFRFNGFSELQPTWCGTSGRSVATNLRFKSTGYLMVINGDCLWLLVINGWLMVINGGCWWLLVTSGWLMVINGDCWWLFVTNGWLMVINGDCWWLLVTNGWLMVIVDDCWWSMDD